MQPIKKLVLATHNKGKLREIKDLLAPYGVEVISAGELGLSEPAETEDSFVGNALIKARAASGQTGCPALADDSGLCVSALGGAPGVYTANWAGPTKDFQSAMQRVHAEIGTNPDRSAYFVSVLALVFPDGAQHLFEGQCPGQIIWPPRGGDGFGYDPIFVPEGETRTFGEMELAEKKKYSHRARAFEKLIQTMFTA